MPFNAGNLFHLEFFLRLIDERLSELYLKIEKTKDPESEGLYDLSEYLIGYGFVAVQRYMASTYPLYAIGKKESFGFGAKLKNDLTLMELIDAAANYWKHEPEWPFQVSLGQADNFGMAEISINRAGEDFSRLEKLTYDRITKITPYSDYTLSNVLAEILKDISTHTELFFRALLPFIQEWEVQLKMRSK